jgi:hypothetical protein
VIARHRGEERVHSRWRPMPPAPRVPESEEPQPSEPVAAPRQQARRRGPLLGIAIVIVVAVIAGQQHGGRTPSSPPLPSTPQQWVDQWAAASLNDPGRVCGRLFAPALARAFKADTVRSCVAYYGNVKSTSFRIQRVLEDGPAAAVEARQVGTARNWGYLSVLLSHVGAGWQAIDIVPGGSVRTR